METKQNYRDVVGDNPNDLSDTKYGNNNVMGPDKEKILHGTQESLLVRNTLLGGKVK
jgi:hypothetical protein